MATILGEVKAPHSMDIVVRLNESKIKGMKETRVREPNPRQCAGNASVTHKLPSLLYKFIYYYLTIKQQ